MRMSPRERILTLLRGRKPDQIPWFGDLDYWANAQITQGKLPAGFIQSQGYIDWHCDLGVGFYLQGFFPGDACINNVDVKKWTVGNKSYQEYHTPKGTLRCCHQWIAEAYTEAPVEHLLKDETDLAAYRYLYENTTYTPNYEYARQRQSQIGEQGVLLCYLPKSPFMQLVALDAGIENLMTIWMNAADELAELLNLMESQADEAAAIAVNSPADILMIPENLSAEVVGPRFFETYMRAFQEKWAKRIAAAGKYSCIHFDGTLAGLLREECSAGLTFLEALTPAPVGDVDVAEWKEYAGDSNTIFWGGLPGIYFTPLVSDEEFERHVRYVLSIFRQEPRYVLGVADQVPPDGLEFRVRRVRELVDEFGRY